MPTNLFNDLPVIERSVHHARGTGPAVAILACLAVLLLLVATLKLSPPEVQNAGAADAAVEVTGP